MSSLCGKCISILEETTSTITKNLRARREAKQEPESAISVAKPALSTEIPSLKTGPEERQFRGQNSSNQMPLGVLEEERRSFKRVIWQEMLPSTFKELNHSEDTVRSRIYLS
jgi:hypothetical protein